MWPSWLGHHVFLLEDFSFFFFCVIIEVNINKLAEHFVGNCSRIFNQIVCYFAINCGSILQQQVGCKHVICNEFQKEAFLSGLRLLHWQAVVSEDASLC